MTDTARSTQQAASSKYADRLSKSKEVVQLEEVSHNVEQTKIEIAASKLQTKSAISREKKKLEALKGEFPLDIDAILDQKAEIADLERGFKGIEELEEELF